MNEKITHEIERCDLDRVHTQARATGTRADFRRNFYQFNIFHKKAAAKVLQLADGRN
jgi:hypothetical protein